MKNNDYSDMFEPKHNSYEAEEKHYHFVTLMLTVFLAVAFVAGLLIAKHYGLTVAL